MRQLFFLWLVCLCWTPRLLAGPRLADTALTQYEKMDVEGWAVYVNPEVQRHPQEAYHAYLLVEEQLSIIKRVVKSDRVKLLQHIPILVDWQSRSDATARYLSSRRWLKQNGYDPNKAGMVEISNILKFIAQVERVQGFVLMHELAHAYHYRVIGSNERSIKAAYQAAVRSRIYERVPHSTGGGSRKPHPCLISDREFFAEMSMTYLYAGRAYPFNRRQMAEYDPNTYNLMRSIWTDGRAAVSEEARRYGELEGLEATDAKETKSND